MGFSEILNGLLNEVSKKAESYDKMKQEVEREIQQLKSKSNKELQQIADGWGSDARKRAARIILNHRHR